MKKGNSILGAIILLFLSSAIFGGALPLNTGWDYANYTTFSTSNTTTPLDNYWIKISTFPASTGTPGPTWPASYSPWLSLPPGLVASNWIGAYGNPPLSGAGTTPQNPGYSIYRKCFCLPNGYGQASIRGAVRSDEAIQIWINSQLNTVLPPSPGNWGTTPHTINYATQSGFRNGKNCIYALVEDTMGTTGFNLNAAVYSTNGTPMIAQGVNMAFTPCACGGVGVPGPAMRRMEDEDKKAADEIIKMAEAKRIERIRNPMN